MSDNRIPCRVALFFHGYSQGKGSYWDLFDLFRRHEKTLIFYNGNDDLFPKPPLTPIVKIQQFNSELYMEHFQEVFKSDLQAMKIRLGYFLEMFHV